jgi:hypothetical protein
VLSWTIQALSWTIQATDSPQCSLGLIQAIGPSSAPLDYPSHWFTPNGVVQLHCTRLQCSLHFSTYTLAMQSMVSTFIQHPSTYPSGCPTHTFQNILFASQIPCKTILWNFFLLKKSLVTRITLLFGRLANGMCVIYSAANIRQACYIPEVLNDDLQSISRRNTNTSVK